MVQIISENLTFSWTPDTVGEEMDWDFLTLSLPCESSARFLQESKGRTGSIYFSNVMIPKCLFSVHFFFLSLIFLKLTFKITNPQEVYKSSTAVWEGNVHPLLVHSIYIDLLFLMINEVIS